MKTEKLNYHLPNELVAQQPSDVRSRCRLLVLDRSNGRLTDSQFSRIADFLKPGDCLVLNDTKVLQARFFAQRTSGGKLEGLFLSQNSDGLWHIMLKGARRVKIGESIQIKNKAGKEFCRAVLIDKHGEGNCQLKLETAENAEVILEKIGYPPLPSYIKRNTDPAQAAKDRQYYQTVYARRAGAVAAPTAGLHFTSELIEQLKDKQIRFAYITLHVGAGTFKPVTTETLEEHKIHEEKYSIDAENARLINEARQTGGRIIAVGTTSARVLETAACNSKLTPASGTTDLFIKPGYKFKIIDGMVTNFHLPKSTLLALVAAFAGLENTLNSYKHAIEKRYRFYSYGDAMLII